MNKKRPGRPKRRRGPSKHNALDKAFSILIRERADWTCERCHVNFRDNPGNLHCSHFYSRGRQSVRFDPMNAAAHCAKCHWYLSHRVPEFAEWIKKHLDGSHEQLRRRASATVKRTEADKSLMLLQMRETAAWMKQERDQGRTGRLEFEAPWCHARQDTGGTESDL